MSRNYLYGLLMGGLTLLLFTGMEGYGLYIDANSAGISLANGFFSDSTNIVDDLIDGELVTEDEDEKKEGINWSKQLERLKYIAFWGLFIVLSRYSDRAFRRVDNFCLRIQRIPNEFDGFKITGNPYIFKGIFYAMHHLFLGRSIYRSYLVWPLKYSVQIAFIIAIVLRVYPDVSLNDPESFKTLFESGLKAQIVMGIPVLLYVSLLVLLCIESVRKCRWLFFVRMTLYISVAILIAFLMKVFFWLVVIIVVIYLLTSWGQAIIDREKHTAVLGYETDDYIYETWPDKAEKEY